MQIDECIFWLSIIFITILCTPQPTIVRWSSTPPVTEEVLLQWKGFCAIIANAYYMRGMAWWVAITVFHFLEMFRLLYCFNHSTKFLLSQKFDFVLIRIMYRCMFYGTQLYLLLACIFVLLDSGHLTCYHVQEQTLIVSHALTFLKCHLLLVL